MAMGPDLMSCRNCGARLPPPPPGARYMHCQYCNQGFDLGPAPPPPVAPFGGFAPPPVSQFGQPHVHVVKMPSPGRYALYFALPLFFVVVSITISMIASRNAQRHAEEMSAAAAQGGAETTAATTTPAAAARSTLRWGGGRADYPVIASIAGADDFVGFYQESINGEIKVGGFDGGTLKKVWGAGGFGAGWDQGQHAYVAVAGGKVAASDYRGRVRIFDVKSGAEEGQVTLSDKAEAITSAPGDKAQVWVKVKDGRDVLVDLASRRATNAKRPAWAAEPYWADTHCRFHSPNTKCVERSARAPVGKELVVDRVMSDGDLRVAVARKYPGTEIAFLLGFKEGAKAAAWKAQVVEGDPVIAQPGTTIPVELGGGRAIAVYDMTNSGGKHMTAFDAKTGDRLWNVHLPFDPAGHYSVRVTETRVYFPYAAVLWAFDARTGKLVGQIGK